MSCKKSTLWLVSVQYTTSYLRDHAFMLGAGTYRAKEAKKTNIERVVSPSTHARTMESVRNLFHVSLPNYLKSIPIPKDFGGFSELSFNELLRLFAFVVFIALIIFALIRLFFGGGGGGGGNGNDVTAKTRSSDDKQAGWINASIDKDKNKVATSKDIEELGEKAVFCRCWKSKKVRRRKLIFFP